MESANYEDESIATIILPTCECLTNQFQQFLNHYQELSKCKGITIVISDNSKNDTQAHLKTLDVTDSFIVLLNDWDSMSRCNQKTLNIQRALRVCDDVVYIFADTDTRLGLGEIRSLSENADKYGIAKAHAYYTHPGFVEEIDAAGGLMLNILCRDKQFWGFIAFSNAYKQSLLNASASTLFDELTFYRSARDDGAELYYCNQEYVSMESHTEYSKFVKQRVRYSYEDLAYPCRTLIYLLMVPVIIGSYIYSSVAIMAILISMILGSIALSYVGYEYCRYENTCYSRYIILYAPLYLSLHALLAWPCIVLFICRKGVTFSGNSIRRPG